MDVRERAVDRTAGFEKFIEHMYLDTKGKVTVGYGHMLESATAATAVPFMKADSSKPTNQEVKDEWALINSKEAGKGAGYYKQFTKLVITEPAAKDDLKKKLVNAASDLAVRFPKIDECPEDPQDALLDMMYNIGLTKFTEAKWPKLFSAVKSQNWTEAASNCYRPDVNQERNDAIKSLFLAAAASISYILAARQSDSLAFLLSRQLNVVDQLLKQQRGSDGLLSNGLRSLEIEISDHTHAVRVKLDL